MKNKSESDPNSLIWPLLGFVALIVIVFVIVFACAPSKIRGLYGVKLDEPFFDKTAVREGNHFDVSCEGKPCKSIRADVIDKSGKAYVTEIGVVSKFSLDHVLSLLTEKYGIEPRKRVFDDYSGATTYYYFDDRKNSIMVYERGREVYIHAYGKLHFEQWEKQQENEDRIRREARKREIEAL